MSPLFKTAGIQVKTHGGSRRSWILNQKAEDYHAPNLFYVFVCLKEGRQSEYFIVPSKTVVKFVKEGHALWLKTPGKNGRIHRDSSMRKFHDPDGKYLNRPDLLRIQCLLAIYN